MRLRTDVTAARAIDTLRDLATRAKNLHSFLQGPVTEQTVHRARDQYLQWADDAEDRLRELFPYRSKVGALQTDRYWRIHEMDRYSARPLLVIGQEIDLQARLLTEAATRLETYTHLRDRPGEALVLDTNTFLHCTLFTEIDWSAEFGVKAVRLVVPAVVLDELDEKTFARNQQLAKRADKVLRTLAWFTDAIASDGMAEIRTGVSLEVLLDDDDHRRRVSNDAEVLDRAVFLHQVIERPVTVVTSDIKMGVTGKIRGLCVRAMPERWRLPFGNEERAPVGVPAADNPVPQPDHAEETSQGTPIHHSRST